MTASTATPASFFLLIERDAEFVEGVEQLGVDLIETLFELFGLRGGVIADSLEVDGGNVEMRPVGWREGEEIAVSVEAELQQPFGLVFEARYGAYGVFAQSRRHNLCVDVGDEAVFVFFLLGAAEEVAARFGGSVIGTVVDSLSGVLGVLGVLGVIGCVIWCVIWECVFSGHDNEGVRGE